MARPSRTSALLSARPARLRAAALLVALVTLAGMRLFGAAGGALGGFEELLGKARTGQELEGPLSPVGDWMYSQRAAGTGVVTAGAYARALDQAADLKEATAESGSELAAEPWTFMGPINIGGRVSEIALDPTPADIVYAATASGGVWKSTDGAVTWTYSWDPNLTQAMGAIAVASDGTIYAGTGEPNPGGGSVVWGGTGLYRSKDGGATWQFIGLPTSGAIGRIAVDPSDPKRIFVASSGNLFVPGGERGVYRTTDGGATWQRILAGDNATTGAVDVAVDPANPQNLLAAMWDHEREPTHRRYTGPGSGVYLSRNGGATWQRSELPGNVVPEQVGRIGVAFAPSTPTRAYAVVANKGDGTGVGVWRSNDGGATWSKTSASVGSLSQSSYGWWFGKVWVDPADADRLFVAGLELVESTDGGDTFTAHGSSLVGVVTGVAHHVMPHADQHGMVWDPHIPGRVYVANDGGVYRSNADGRIGTWVGSASQGWTQHYSVDVGEQSPSRVVTGLQDNMCQRNYAAGDVSTAPAFTKFGLCGDGLQTLINPVDEKVVYACSQYGSCSRFSDGGVAPLLVGGFGGTSGRKGWWVPLQFDPSNPAVMYYGSNFLFRSTNGGQAFTQISEDLTGEPDQLDPNPGYRIYGVITWVAAAKSDPDVIYVGTDTGKLWRTSDLGQEWTELSDPDDPATPEDENDLPGTWVTKLAVDPTDANVAYATFSGFRDGDDTAHVVKTADGGATWTNISGNLPDAPVNEIVVVPGGKLVVGTDVGVFMTSDGGVTWLTVGSNMPAVPVLDVRYHEGTNTLTAATFGHGIQRIALP